MNEGENFYARSNREKKLKYDQVEKKIGSGAGHVQKAC